MSPEALSARPVGWLSWPLRASAASAKPAVPSPAIVVIVPPETCRTRWLSWSAMRKPPSAVASTREGLESFASVAAPPSPEKPALVPATVLIVPVGGDLADAVVVAVGDEVPAVGRRGDADRLVQRRGGRRPAVTAQRGGACPGHGVDDAARRHLPDAVLVDRRDEVPAVGLREDVVGERQLGARRGTAVTERAAAPGDRRDRAAGADPADAVVVRVGDQDRRRPRSGPRRTARSAAPPSPGRRRPRTRRCRSPATVVIVPSTATRRTRLFT